MTEHSFFGQLADEYLASGYSKELIFGRSFELGSDVGPFEVVVAETAIGS